MDSVKWSVCVAISQLLIEFSYYVVRVNSFVYRYGDEFTRKVFLSHFIAQVERHK